MTQLKISVPDWCFYGKLAEGPRYYELLGSLGVECVEMVPPERHAMARDAGLRILNQSGPGMQEGLNRFENHAQLLPQIRESLRSAAAAAIPLVIVFSGSSAGQAEAEGMENCRRGIEALLPEAERAGVVLGFEMLNIHDHPDYQACRGRYGFALAAGINSPWLKLVYDIYHMERMGDDSARDVAGNLGQIAHLHVAESPHRDKPLAHGVIRYESIVPLIVKAGYDGVWGLEFIPRGDPLGDLRESIGMLRQAAKASGPRAS